jgi:uncharacterized protein (TIGR03067 family)
MIRSFLVALVVGLTVAGDSLGVADKQKKDGGRTGAKELEGTWMIVSAKLDGWECQPGKGEKWVFMGKIVTIKMGGKEEVMGTFQIDPKKKTLDVIPAQGGYQGEKYKGIYQLKDGELTMCFSIPDNDRPRELTSERGSGLCMFVLKRAKSKSRLGGPGRWDPDGGGGEGLVVTTGTGGGRPGGLDGSRWMFPSCPPHGISADSPGERVVLGRVSIRPMYDQWPGQGWNGWTKGREKHRKSRGIKREWTRWTPPRSSENP